MLGSFRRFTKSKLGAIVALVVLAFIGIAFAVTDVTGLGGGAGGADVKTAADVGKEQIGETELVSRTKTVLANIQQQQPTADMAGLIAQNGVERILDSIIDRRAAGIFAREQGLVVSDKAVEGVIASIFRGPDGKFSRSAFDNALAQQRMSERSVRDDIATERLVQFLTAPANGAIKVPAQYALPYASLLLERRKGSVAVIPAAALPAGAAPTDAEVAAFYRANIARYTVPERRVIRYASITPASVLASAAPTDAELQAAFKANPARFAATERRTAQVVTALDRGTANTIASAVKAGAGIEAAARAAGLEPRTLTRLDKAAVTAQISADFADALFAAPANAAVGPVRGSGGSFIIAKVSAIDTIAAKTFAQARAELLPEVTKQNQASRLGRLNDAIDKAVGEGATFDEIVRAQKLTAQKSPAVMQNGRDPFNLTAAPDPALAPVVQAAFGAEPGDSPQIVSLGTDGGFALVTLDQVLPSAPRPLAEIRADVAKAFQLRRAQTAARAVAAGVVARADAGTPFATALAQTGLKLPPTRPIDVPRAAFAANPQQADPALAMLFAMAARRAKLLELPDRSGWAVIWLDSITPGDARSNKATLQAAQGDLNRVAGGELIQQLFRAIRNAVGVKTNPAAVARARAELSGATPGPRP